MGVGAYAARRWKAGLTVSRLLAVEQHWPSAAGGCVSDLHSVSEHVYIPPGSLLSWVSLGAAP